MVRTPGVGCAGIRAGFGRALRPVVTAAVLAAALLSSGCQGNRGTDSPEALAQAYVAALNARDEGAIEQLTAAHLAPQAEIRRVLSAQGGQDIRILDTQVREPVSPDFPIVEIKGQSRAGTYQESLRLSRDGERWRLLLGDPKPSPESHSPTSGTTRPTAGT